MNRALEMRRAAAHRVACGLRRAAPAVVALVLGLASQSAARAPGNGDCPPPTPRRTVVDRYHEAAVRDDYRWLEDGADPAVRRWSDEQNACARAFLDKLPERDAVRRRVEEIVAHESPSWSDLQRSAGLLFAIENRPPKQQPYLIVMRSADPVGARVVVDPNRIDASGLTTIDWYRPSPDGRLVAVSLSRGGSEAGTLHLYEVAGGKPVYETLERVQEGTAGGDLAWDRDGRGFYYTRYPRGTERPPADRDFYQQVWHHVLGTPPDRDTYSIGRDWPRIAETSFKRREDGRSILAIVDFGDGGERAFFVLGQDDRWVRVADFGDEVKDAEFGPGESLFLLSRRSAPNGKVLRLDLDAPDLRRARVVVPPSDASIEQCMPGESRLYVRDMIGGPSRVRVTELDGRPVGVLPVPPVTSVHGLIHAGGDDLLLEEESDVTPAAWYRYDAHSGALHRTALAETSPVDFSDTEVLRVQAVSRDGTRVPMTLLMRRGTRPDRDRPTTLTGYGGFGLSQRPSFNALAHVWIEHGGIVATASLRGGAEFGESWHRAGKLTHKQNVFDDFAACARALIERGWTRPARLAIEGGSNGGLLMGAALTQHPDLFAAVSSRAGIYDMLRVELSSNGSFNTTEYGSVKDAAQFRALYAYSPYHHVHEGTRYPAVLFTTGANDPRVDPMQSRKMIARLQAASASDRPILLRTSGTSGHGIGSSLSEFVAVRVDAISFLFHELGVDMKNGGRAAAR